MTVLVLKMFVRRPQFVRLRWYPRPRRPLDIYDKSDIDALASMQTDYELEDVVQTLEYDSDDYGIPEENILSDSAEDEDDDNFETEREEQEKLWQRIISSESSSLTADDFNALMAAMQNVHSLPDTAMNAICKLLSACLPRGHTAPACYSQIVKQMLSKSSVADQIITYVCSAKSCGKILKKLFDFCDNPRCSLANQKQHASGFLRIRIQPQIEAIIRARYLDIYHFLSSTPYCGDSEVGDIPTTPAYSALGQNPIGDTLNISLIISSDGAQAFKMSRSSFWPCIAIVAELPPKVRVAAENAIGLGFWVGRGEKAKPNWKLFLPSIISELKTLKEGFEIEVGGKSIRICVRILATIFDLPAQASIWGTKQYNGDYGCIKCRHPGERHGLLCLWPKVSPTPPTKDSAFFEEAWTQLAKSASNDFYGVIRLSPLARICNPASVNIFDSMHLVYRGNAQLIFNRLFTSKPKKWSALFGKTLLLDIDRIVKDIRFPHYFNRKVPSLAAIGSFKASEIKNLLMYAVLPITAAYMERIPDYWHWVSVYVHAIRLLSQPIVSNEDADRAQVLINIWQQLIPDLCHEKSQTFNSHAVEHLPSQVKQFGPLWSISTFAFEGFNGHFARYIKSAKGVLLQLGRRFALQQLAYAYLSSQVRNQEPCSSVIKNMFPELYQRWTPKKEDDRYRLLNEKKTCGDPEIMDLLHIQFADCSDADFCFGTRAARGSEVLHSVRHNAKTASIVKYTNITDDLGESYGEVYLFVKARGDIYLVIKPLRTVVPTNILQVPAPSNELLFSAYDDRIYGSFFSIVDKTNYFEIVQIFDVLCTAVLIEAFGTYTVTDVLPFEHD